MDDVGTFNVDDSETCRVKAEDAMGRIEYEVSTLESSGGVELLKPEFSLRLTAEELGIKLGVADGSALDGSRETIVGGGKGVLPELMVTVPLDGKLCIPLTSVLGMAGVGGMVVTAVTPDKVPGPAAPLIGTETKDDEACVAELDNGVLLASYELTLTDASFDVRAAVNVVSTFVPEKTVAPLPMLS